MKEEETIVLETFLEHVNKGGRCGQIPDATVYDKDGV